MLAGSGTAGTEPGWANLVEGCGYMVLPITSTSVIIRPLSQIHTTATINYGRSVTLGCYIDGLLFKLVGARGNVKWALNSGETPKASFEFQGVYVLPSDTALLSAPTYDTTIPQAIINGSFTLDTVAMKYKSLEIDTGNKLAIRHNPSSAQGALSCAITGRNVTGSMDPEYELAATYNYFSKMTTNDPAALTLTIGATSGNIITVTAPNVQYSAIQPGDRDGLQVGNLSLAFISTFTDGGSTTVNNTSASGQAVLYVAATGSFAVGDEVRIGQGTVREETGYVLSIQAGTSLTLINNLVNSHTLAQADAVVTVQANDEFKITLT
jgi:hypothetical protein